MQDTTRFTATVSFVRAAAILAVSFACAQTSVANEREDKEVIEVCRDEMVNNREASSVRDMDARDHEDRDYAYGTADFADMKNVHFRCRVKNGEVIGVQYLVRDPDYTDGRAWTKNRPHSDDHADFPLDEAAKSSPPPIATAPKFERVKD